ncbi:MAG: signal peptidase II [Pseudomonadota bacterium]|nr:signal peptidase II [Pseudomonadota bacterium]
MIISFVILAFDQLSKWWIVFYIMQPPQVIEIAPFFNLVMGWNYGISFGLLNSMPEISVWILPFLVFLITSGLIIWLYFIDKNSQAIGLGFIIGGAIGNLIDRLHFGAVVDFLDFHAWGFHWPAFNIADSAITIGAIMLVLDSLFESKKKL